jgi:hypothetical protein
MSGGVLDSLVELLNNVAEYVTSLKPLAGLAIVNHPLKCYL